MGAPGLPCEEGVSPPLRSTQVGASGHHDPHREGAPPRTWTFFARGFAPLHSPSGGLWPPRPTWGGRSAPPTPGSYLSMRGAAPLGSKSSDLAPHSPSGGQRPPRPPWGGRSAPPPRVTFPSRGKSPKARQGLPPFGIPPVRRNRPLWCFASLAPGLLSATRKDRFATFRLWANRSCFSPLVLSRRYFLLSIRGAGVILPRRNPYYPSRRRWPDR